jgi:hypothetical protein
LLRPPGLAEDGRTSLKTRGKPDIKPHKEVVMPKLTGKLYLTRDEDECLVLHSKKKLDAVAAGIVVEDEDIFVGVLPAKSIPKEVGEVLTLKVTVEE